MKLRCLKDNNLFRQVNAVQRTLVETWGLIRETFVDPTFNHQGRVYLCCSHLEGNKNYKRMVEYGILCDWIFG